MKSTLFTRKFKANDKVSYCGKTHRVTKREPSQLGYSGHLYYEIQRGPIVREVRSDKLTKVRR